MSTSDVTREGMRGQRPGREAMSGNQLRTEEVPDHLEVAGRSGAGEPGAGGRRRKGERMMVPRAKFRSYYGLPVLKEPTWKALDIAGYLFLGGLAGASSSLAAGADLTGRRHLAQRGKFGALAAISLGLVGLVHDLGRPSRFTNMLRVLKPTSPMSVGSWLLGAYGPATGIAAATSATGRFPRIGRAATLGAGALGPAVASYTAVLVADTATPAWHGGHRELPFIFVGSGAAAAGGLGLLAAPLNESGPAARVAVAGAATELAGVRLMKKRLGMVAETYDEGRAGALMRASEALNAVGIVATLAGRRSRAASMLAGASLMGASACARFGIFEAGRASAKDPKYTVVPQRERLDAMDGDSQPAR